MKVNCVSCGHVVDLRDSYDDYEGQIKCFTCGSLLDIRTEDGQVKHVEIDVRVTSGKPRSQESVDRQMQEAIAETLDS